MRGLSAPGVVKKLSNILRKQHFDADVSDAADPLLQLGNAQKNECLFRGQLDKTHIWGTIFRLNFLDKEPHIKSFCSGVKTFRSKQH